MAVHESVSGCASGSHTQLLPSPTGCKCCTHIQQNTESIAAIAVGTIRNPEWQQWCGAATCSHVVSMQGAPMFAVLAPAAGEGMAHAIMV